MRVISLDKLGEARATDAQGEYRMKPENDMGDAQSEPDAPSDEGPLFLGKAEREHFAAIGMVASQWAYFELSIDIKTLELAMIPEEVGLCITTQVVGSGRKLDAYIALARQLGSKNKNSDLDNFYKDNVGLAERRNRVIHDPWLIDQERQPKRLEATARKKLRYIVVTSPTSEIERLAFEIMDHAARFGELHEAITAELRL
jgi:hypothetical protein